MRLYHIPFEAIDWSTIEESEHPGVIGVARWRTRQFGDVRVRMVEYSPGYVANHWCQKGHVVLCLEGEIHTKGTVVIGEDGVVQGTISAGTLINSGKIKATVTASERTAADRGPRSSGWMPARPAGSRPPRSRSRSRRRTRARAST